MYPDSVYAIVEEETEKNGNDIQRAVERAKGRICLLPEYPELVDTLIETAVRSLVQDRRHANNVAIRKSGGFYSQPTALKDSSALNSAATAATNYYSYAIGNRTLGNLLGSELEPLAKQQHALGVGYLNNERLLNAIIPLASDPERTVQQQVKANKLKQIFLQVFGGDSGATDPCCAKPASGRTKVHVNTRAVKSARDTHADVPTLAGH